VHETFNTLSAGDDFAAIARGDVPIIHEATGEDVLVRAQRYARRLGVGLQGATGKGHAFVNGRYFPVDDVSGRPSNLKEHDREFRMQFCRTYSVRCLLKSWHSSKFFRRWYVNQGSDLTV
jgi:hypothetical protein